MVTTATSLWQNTQLRVCNTQVETLTYARFPMEHWRRIRTNNGIERLNREVKRRTNAVGSFPDGRSAMTLAAARCKYVADGNWGKRRYLDISLLDHWDERSVSTD